MTARRRKPAPAARTAWRAPDTVPAAARPGAGAPAPVASPAENGATPFSWSRPDMAALVAAVLGPLALYAATLPRTVVLEDDGLFLMAGVHLGVAHPPGYPLYTLIVHLFTRLPFGDRAVLRASVERGARGPGLRRRVRLSPATAGVARASPGRGVGSSASRSSSGRRRSSPRSTPSTPCSSSWPTHNSAFRRARRRHGRPGSSSRSKAGATPGQSRRSRSPLLET